MTVTLLILVAAGGTFYETARRFFVPFGSGADWFTCLAAILYALVCRALMLLYFVPLEGLAGATLGKW